MNIPYENHNNNAAPANGAKPKKSAKGKLLVTILIFLILTFIVNSLLLANAIHTKYVTYQALGSFVALPEEGEEKAATQGNLGNYNIVSKRNSLVDNKNKTYTLTIQLEFVNYGKTGRSFNDAVEITAYQNDKEVNAVLSPDEASSEADVKVRNGQSANVVISYLLTDTGMDVNLDMMTASGNNEFIYTVKLSQPKDQTQNAEKATEKETDKKE